jgi:hypothetical protein
MRPAPVLALPVASIIGATEVLQLGKAEEEKLAPRDGLEPPTQ